jgi:hypothetical protein
MPTDRRQDDGMTDRTETFTAYAHILQTAYNHVRMSKPESVSVAEDRLIAELEPHGVILTSDVVHALSFAAVAVPQS